MAEHFTDPLIATFKVLVRLACHVVVAGFILVGIRSLELLIQLLWRSQEPILLGFLPLKYVVHGVDLGVLLAFGFYGIISVARTFRESGR